MSTATRARRQVSLPGPGAEPPAISETEFLRQVLELAAMLGWSAAHFRPALTARGWRTPVQGNLGAGFPDLVLASPTRGRLLFVELKSDVGRVSADQAAVLAALEAAGARCYVWRPRDFDRITEILQGLEEVNATEVTR
jgi:hypothetical protein